MASSGWRPEMLLNSLQCAQDKPPPKKKKKVTSAKVENPWARDINMEDLFKMIIFKTQSIK